MVDDMPVWKKILYSHAVWSAFLAWANGLVLILWPAVPRDMLILTNALVGAILAAIGISNVTVPAVRAYRVRRAALASKQEDE